MSSNNHDAPVVTTFSQNQATAFQFQTSLSNNSSPSSLVLNTSEMPANTPVTVNSQNNSSDVPVPIVNAGIVPSQQTYIISPHSAQTFIADNSSTLVPVMLTNSSMENSAISNNVQLSTGQSTLQFSDISSSPVMLVENMVSESDSASTLPQLNATSVLAMDDMEVKSNDSVMSESLMLQGPDESTSVDPSIQQTMNTATEEPCPLAENANHVDADCPLEPHNLAIFHAVMNTTSQLSNFVNRPISQDVPEKRLKLEGPAAKNSQEENNNNSVSQFDLISKLVSEVEICKCEPDECQRDGKGCCADCPGGADICCSLNNDAKSGCVNYTIQGPSVNLNEAVLGCNSYIPDINVHDPNKGYVFAGQIPIGSGSFISQISNENGMSNTNSEFTSFRLMDLFSSDAKTISNIPFHACFQNASYPLNLDRHQTDVD